MPPRPATSLLSPARSASLASPVKTNVLSIESDVRSDGTDSANEQWWEILVPSDVTSYWELQGESSERIHVRCDGPGVDDVANDRLHSS
jgi:hypothetical protein